MKQVVPSTFPLKHLVLATFRDKFAEQIDIKPNLVW